MVFVIIGVILIGLGIFLFFRRKRLQEDLTSYMISREATVAELKAEFDEVSEGIGRGHYTQIIALHGHIESPNPLKSELTRQDCVKYRTVVERDWEEDYQERTEQGDIVRRTRRGSDTVTHNEQEQPFYVNDGTGSIRVSPGGAEIDLVKVTERYEPVNYRQFSGPVSIGNLHLNLMQGLSSQRRLLGYRYQEWVLPVGRRVFIHGEVSDSGGELTFQKPGDPEKDEPYTISLKSKSELIHSTKQKLKTLLILSVLSFIAGVVLIIIGLMQSSTSVAPM